MSLADQPIHQSGRADARHWCQTLGGKVIIPIKFLTLMLSLLMVIPSSASQRAVEVDLAIVVALAERCAFLDPSSIDVNTAALNALTLRVGMEKIEEMKKSPNYMRALQDVRIALQDRDLTDLSKACSSLRDYKNELNK